MAPLSSSSSSDDEQPASDISPKTFSAINLRSSSPSYSLSVPSRQRGRSSLESSPNQSLGSVGNAASKRATPQNAGGMIEGEAANLEETNEVRVENLVRSIKEMLEFLASRNIFYEDLNFNKLSEMLEDAESMGADEKSELIEEWRSIEAAEMALYVRERNLERKKAKLYSEALKASSMVFRGA